MNPNPSNEDHLVEQPALVPSPAVLEQRLPDRQ
jgi:hypothetical protein